MPTPSTPYLSVIIPAYREEARIGPTLNRLTDYLNSSYPDHQVIVVDDGSDDNTGPIAEKFVEGDPARRKLITLPVNMGKGNAVKAGMLAASGRYVMFIDADLPYRLEAIQTLIHNLEHGGDLAIGARDLPESVAEVKYPLIRRLWSYGYSWLIGKLLMPGIPDTQCGLKAFTNQAARSIFSQVSVTGFGFDVEVLYMARMKGFDIRRVPVRMIHSQGSKVRLFKDSSLMFMDLLKVRSKANAGKYGTRGGTVDQISGDYQYRALTEGNRVQRAWHRHKLELITKHLAPKPEETILDAGCGSAIAALRANGARYVGIDLNRKSLRFGAWKFPEHTFVRAISSEMPFKDDTFDKAMFIEVIEHLSPEDALEGVTEIIRVLKPGGLLLITTPNPRSAWPLIEKLMDRLKLAPKLAGDQHISEWNRDRLTTLGVNSGALKVKIGTFNGLSPFTASVAGARGAHLFHKLEQAADLGTGNLLWILLQKPL